MHAATDCGSADISSGDALLCWLRLGRVVSVAVKREISEIPQNGRIRVIMECGRRQRGRVCFKRNSQRVYRMEIKIEIQC